MRDAIDVADALCRLHDRSDAWRFICGFAAGWATPITEADGVSPAELDAAEARLGIRLPAAVRQAYQLFGRRTDLTSQHGTLYRPDKLDCDPSEQVLVFRAAHQGVFYGVPLTDPQQDDPPAVAYATLMDKTHESWEPFVERFSVACVDMLLREHMEAGRFSDGRALVAGEAASLVSGLAHTTFPRYEGGYANSRWYAGDDIILCIDDDTWAAVCARSREALDAFQAAHPGRWVNSAGTHRQEG